MKLLKLENLLRIERIVRKTTWSIFKKILTHQVVA